MEQFVITVRELERQEVIRRLIKKEINATEAALQLSLSIRQVVRLKRSMEKEGAQGLVHGNRGKASNRRLGADGEALIVSLVEEKYLDFTPTFVAEKLEELHGIRHDPKTITRILVTAGIWQKKNLPHKSKQIHRTWRQRRPHYGELIQFDGSYEYWLEDRNKTGRMCLLASIDDATGKITYAKFVAHEGVFPVFSFWQEYVILHGKPMSIYLDKFSTYNQNQPSKNTINDTLTQFERAAQTLQIELIKANSPQAKGRVERLFHTLQDRLVKELRLASISTIPEANIFLISIFIPNFNQKFSVLPIKEADIHRRLTGQEQKKLPSIFSRQTKRVVQNDFTISFNNQYFQLTKENQPLTICKKEVITIEEWTNKTLHLKLRDKELHYILLPARPIKQSKAPWIIPANQKTIKTPSLNPYGYTSPKAHKPPKNHPWKTFIPKS